MIINNYNKYLQLHFVVFLWGFTSILGYLIHINPIEIVFYRSIIASIILLLIILFHKDISFSSQEKILIPKLIATGFLVSIHWFLFFSAIKLSTISIAMVGISTISLFTSFIDPISKGLKIKRYEIGMALIVIASLGVIFHSEFIYISGLFLAIGAAILASTFSVINSHFTKKANYIIIALFEMIGCSICSLLIIQFQLIDSPFLSLTIPSLEDMFYIFILGSLCTAYTFYNFVKLLDHFSTFYLALSINMEPIYGIILALIFFGEKEKMNNAFYLAMASIVIVLILYPLLKKRYD